MSPADQNGAFVIARAFMIYALVPYLGILFCPGALIMSVIGVAQSFRTPRRRVLLASSLGILATLLILTCQILLWWILYEVPGWAQGL